MFWGGRRAFELFKLPFNRFIKRALDYYLRTQVMFQAFHKSKFVHQTIVQDFAIPFPNAESFIEYVREELGIYPLWLCPVRANHKDQQITRRPFHLGSMPDELALDIGVYGVWYGDRAGSTKMNQALAEKALQCKGIGCLYAPYYHGEEKFWEIYDYKAYTKVREKFGANPLPSVYEKVRAECPPEKQQDMSPWERMTQNFPLIWAIYGLLSVIKSRLFQEKRLK